MTLDACDAKLLSHGNGLIVSRFGEFKGRAVRKQVFAITGRVLLVVVAVTAPTTAQQATNNIGTQTLPRVEELHMAAKQGHADAELALGYLYERVLLFVLNQAGMTLLYGITTIEYFVAPNYGAAIVAAAGLVVYARATYLLWREKANAVRWTVISMSFTGMIALVAFLTPPSGPEDADSLVKVAVYTVIWGSYLRTSRRVRNTYNPVRETTAIPVAEAN
jgi:Protein of unknown function (DUF2569)